MNLSGQEEGAEDLFYWRSALKAPEVPRTWLPLKAKGPKVLDQWVLGRDPLISKTVDQK